MPHHFIPVLLGALLILASCGDNLTAWDAPSADSVHGPSDSLAAKVQRVLDDYYLRAPNTRDDSPWEVLHWSIAFGIDAPIHMGGPTGKEASAIGWLCYNYPAAGQRIMACSGSAAWLPVAPGLQGHPGQFLAMLAQSKISSSYGAGKGCLVRGVADIVDIEKRTCRTAQEHTFKLIGLSYYGNSQESWTNDIGENWSVRRLLEDEVEEPINATSTCGGTHRLLALSHAVERRRTEGFAIDGPWELAARRVAAYQGRAFQLQNADGSFSTAWLDRADARNDLATRLNTSGHVLEWLAFSLPDRRLRDEDFERAMEYVANLLDRHSEVRWPWGAEAHALHALSLYEQRVLGTQPGNRRGRFHPF
jgi:hypothetical protein